MIPTRFSILPVAFVLVILITGITHNSNAQGKELIVKIEEPGHIDFDKKVKPDSYSRMYKDSLLRFKAMRQILTSAYEFGFIEATFDSIDYSKNNPAHAYLNIGKQYKWKSISAADPFLNDAGFQQKRYDGKVVNPKSINRLFKRLLTHSENNGFPFASLHLDSIHFDNNGMILAKVLVDKGDLVVIDSVVIKGNSKLNLTYLYNYLSIRPGDIYNESALRKISIRLKEIPFVKEIKPFDVIFNAKKATLVIYIDERKSNTLDGIIGVLPDAEDKRKLNLTGEASISLKNSFHRGEVLDLRWKNQRPKTQDLKIKGNYPFLFSTPFGVEGRLNIYKQDTTYIDLERKIGVQYFLRGGNYFQVFYEGRESNLLSTKRFENATALPEFADVTVTSYGIGYLSEKVDYRFNPTKGYTIEVIGSAGKKTIKKNSNINPELYDSLELKTNLYRVSMNFDYYFPLGKLHVIDVGIIGGLLVSDETFDNELFRFGGLKTLRGFDEEIIRASKYTIWKLEYRYIMEQNSFLFIFVNGALYENKSRNANVQDDPLGFGAGINFETRLGIFSFNYALGKEFNNTFVFRTAKLHFGIVNYF